MRRHKAGKSYLRTPRSLKWSPLEVTSLLAFKRSWATSSKMGSGILREGVEGAGGGVGSGSEGVIDRERPSVCWRCNRESRVLICASSEAISSFSARARSEMGSVFLLNHAIVSESSPAEQQRQERRNPD